MGKRGPKPQPTSILRLKGSWHANGRTDEPHEEALAAIPDPPATLKEVGRVKWMDVCMSLQLMGILEPRFLDTVFAYAEEWDRKADAEAVLQAEGMYYAGKYGPVRHPASLVLKETKDAIRRLAGELGLTPSSATSIKGTGKPTTGGVHTRARGGVERFRIG